MQHDFAVIGASTAAISDNDQQSIDWRNAMSDPQVTLDPLSLSQRVLSRWENEGGAIYPVAHAIRAAAPVMTNAELVHLHIRVIALENILIAVLAQGSKQQLEVACDMADLIAPREGSTPHALTMQAAKHITDLVGRAVHYQAASS